MENEKRLIDANDLEEAITTDFWEHYTQCHDTDQRGSRRERGADGRTTGIFSAKI